MAAGVPSRRSMVVLESREPPAHFANAGSPAPDTTLNLKIALTAANRDGLEQKLFDVSTPGNVLYGQHLSYEEAKAFAGPTPDTVQAVTSWLNENGIQNIATTGAFGEWLGFSVPVSTANSLFNANYQQFNEIGGPTKLTRTLTYSIPADLQPHINIVHPSTDFVRVSKGPQFHTPVPSSGSNNTARSLIDPITCDLAITPPCLQDLYGIPTNSATQQTNQLGVSGFLNQWPQHADLQHFLETFANVPSSTSWQLEILDGGSDPQGAENAGIEANLDTQYTLGLANGVPVTFFSVGEDNKDGDLDGFLDLMNFINSQPSPPFVLTTSYGADERDISPGLANQLCDGYMIAGARGVSVIFSSGDGGVSGSQSQSCSSFIPTFPSGCPFLTSVGATQGEEETGASFSGGGFSNIFARPSYQADAVGGYLSTLGNTNANLFNPSGRAYPDVSAQGANFVIVNGGEVGTVDGTSCSAPVFASIIALINDRLIAAGTSPLGFLNPFLYMNPDLLSDITSGDNPGCNTTGFPAKAGWDPVTGLGTPKFESLAAAVGL
ncbi:family S53 protease [Rhodocollybia butyracea]|uniref:tripeptidyl-peptidase II n=1 Tax=Rhodocollybia butyracea TaxID=206335 RepID=A0A9P5PK27_9AGAR|nr:family S53 protease [Rhodocollybia butyracea]